MNQTRRKRSRRKRRSLLPLCYKHRKPMRVGRVVGLRQYRYCPVPGCRITLRTMRPKPPREEPGGAAGETSSSPAPIVAEKASPRERGWGSSPFENDAPQAVLSPTLESADTFRDAPVSGRFQSPDVQNDASPSGPATAVGTTDTFRDAPVASRRSLTFTSMNFTQNSQ